MSMYGKFKGVSGPLPVDKWPSTDFKDDKGFTVQADRDDADINKIISRFQKSGQLPPTMKGQPFYGDVSEFGDLSESYMKIQEAERLFMQYPPEVRERFGNDPVELMEFLGNSANRDEAIELGLVNKTVDELHPNDPLKPKVVVPVEPAVKPV